MNNAAYRKKWKTWETKRCNTHKHLKRLFLKMSIKTKLYHAQNI